MMSLAAVMPGKMCRPPQVLGMYMHSRFGFLNLSSHALQPLSQWQGLSPHGQVCTQGDADVVGL